MKKLILSLAVAAAALAAQAEDITVSAAASLADAFTEIAKSFEALHPDDKVHLNFAGSGALLQQLQKGAPADVFASADQKRMNSATESGLLTDGSRRDFAQNTLVVIVPAANDHNYKTLADFVTSPDIKRIVIANPDSVPVGAYSKKALEAAGLWDKIGSKNIPSENVRQSLDYVARGEVDGGFVYQTDAAIMPEKVRVVLDVPLDKPLTYPIAVLKNSAAPKTAQAFVDYVNGAEGHKILAKYGFRAPEAAK